MSGGLQATGAGGYAADGSDAQQAVAALDAARSATLDLSARAEAAEAEAKRLRAELETVQSECRHWQDACLRADHHANRLHDRVLDLHADLRATDLPTLILRACLALTGAEQGLYTGPSGQPILADIGLAELRNLPNEVFYEFTTEAAQSQAPVVRNDGENLPDDMELVNLAAVPVTLRNKAAGVLLVANKRSGPFTDEDTHTLLAVGRHAGIALENVQLHCALAESYASTIAVLADAIKAKDPYTRGHCEEVAALAVRVAERLGVTGKALDDLRYAALLHDVGKIGVPDGILLKPGRLSPEERTVIERHSQIGGDLIERVCSMQQIAPLVRHHHERVDGSGYPDGLQGDAIPLPARIIAVVDALDAMTSPRPYRNAVERSDALAELRRCAGAQFDTQVVATLLELLETDEA